MNFLYSLILIALLWGIKELFKTIGAEGDATIAMIGVVLLSSYLFALNIKKARLPKLTGYMILGVIIGPIGFNLLDHHTMKNLSFLENLALALIAITAGGELKYEKIKIYKKTIAGMFSGQVIIVFAGLFISLLLFKDYLPFFSELNNDLAIGFAILFAATALSISPATTIGIITELKAKGRVTDIVLSVTVIKSIFLVLIFPLVVGVAKIYLIETATLNRDLIYEVAYHIFGSIGLGIVVGVIIIWYLKYIKVERSLFILGAAILIAELSIIFDFEILLMAIVTGIIVENFSKQGESLIEGIEQSSLPLYIIFFCFAGAGLHLETLKQAFVLTLFVVLMRMFFLAIGNYAGAAVAKGDIILKKTSWMSFIAQAGIALGLATVIENTFPGEIGLQFKTILVSSVVINEFLGPIFFKYVLTKAKENTI